MNIVVDAANIPKIPAGIKYYQGTAYRPRLSIASSLYSLGLKSTQSV